VTELENKLWKEFLDAEYTSVLYAKLASRYSKKDRNFKIFLAIAAPSGTIAGWGVLKDPGNHTCLYAIWCFISAIAAISSVVLPFLKYAKKAELAPSIASSYRATAQDYELLWIRREKLNDDQLRKELKMIMDKESKLALLESQFPELNDEYNSEKALKEKSMDEVIQKRGLSNE
jgi:hypothetical protein